MAGRTKKKASSQFKIVELSTVYFYKGPTPKVVPLKDCGLTTKRPVPGIFSAFFGRRGKQEGFMAACLYAAEHDLQYTVIDFLVRLDQKQAVLNMRAEDLPQHDFVNFQRLSKELTNEVGEIFKQRLREEGAKAEAKPAKPLILLMQRPDLVSTLLGKLEWKHFKVIAYSAKLTISEKPLNIGTLPFRHWGAIQEATCRLNPNIQITLDRPKLTKKST